MNLNIFKRLAASEAEIASLRAEFKGALESEIATLKGLLKIEISTTSRSVVRAQQQQIATLADYLQHKMDSTTVVTHLNEAIASVISLIDSKIAENNDLQYKRNARARDYQPIDSPLTVLSVVNVPKPQKIVAKKAPRRTQKIMAAAARVTAKREYARLYYHRMKARKAAALQAAVATAGVTA